MEKSRVIELLEHLACDKDNEGNCYGDALSIAIEALKAQLSQERTTKDAISRQAAIDAIANCTNCGNEKTLREYVTKHSLENGWTGGVLDALNAVQDLPSAQPEPHWILVSERMPEDYADVLVWFEYFRYGDYNCMYATHGIGNYSKEYNSWTINHETGWKDLHVFAWMPLPTPYKPNNE